MTAVPRRRPKPTAPAAPDTKPWPSQAEPEARVTTEGKVSSSPSPVQAMWAEAIGRWQYQPYSAARDEQAEGLCVALAILTCATLKDVRAELARRADVPDS